MLYISFENAFVSFFAMLFDVDCVFNQGCYKTYVEVIFDSHLRADLTYISTGQYS